MIEQMIKIPPKNDKVLNSITPRLSFIGIDVSKILLVKRRHFCSALLNRLPATHNDDLIILDKATLVG